MVVREWRNPSYTSDVAKNTKNMIELESFNQGDFVVFKAWIQSEEELLQFAGRTFSYPVTDEQLVNYINTPDKRSFKVVLKATNETIGHCSLNFENGNYTLCRILVGNKELRGQKIGEQIIRKMADLLFLDPKIDKVDLNVFDFNKAAIRCYEKVGFKIDHKNTTEITVKGKPWTRLNMVLERNQRSI